MMAEAAVTLVSIERFLRILLEHHGIALGEDESVYNLLQRATAGERPLIRLPVADREVAIKQIAGIRNSLLHGNYGQAAARAGAVSVGSYFGTPFAAEVEGLFRLLDLLMRQIDAETGMPLPR